ncbi:hypothetical protein L208DRAFT_1467313, partial [Tricholoma matsutake]
MLGPWVLTESHGPSLEVSNCYFTPAKLGLRLESIPFQENIDPSGLLTKMLASLGAQCTHTEDNEVEFEVCHPQSFRQGDIVELQLSFVVVPLKEDSTKGKQYKMLVVLQSMALLDTQFST